MGRPRKDRTAEYSALLAEEITLQISQAVQRTVETSLEAYQAEVATLSSELKALRRQVDELSRRVRPTKTKPRIGRWVPGGPGRPPKDAAERIAAFTAKTDGEDVEPKPKKKKKKKG